MKRFIVLIVLVLLPLMAFAETFKYGQTALIHWNVINPTTGELVSATSGVDIIIYHSDKTTQLTSTAMTEDETGVYSYSWSVPTDVEDVYYAKFSYAYGGTSYSYVGNYYNVVSDSTTIDISNSLTLVDSVIALLLSKDIQAFSHIDSSGTVGYYLYLSDTSFYDIANAALATTNAKIDTFSYMSGFAFGALSIKSLDTNADTLWIFSPTLDTLGYYVLVHVGDGPGARPDSTKAVRDIRLVD